MKAPADFDDTDYDYGGSNYSALKPESVVPDLSDEEMEELDGGDIFLVFFLNSQLNIQ